MGNYVDCIVRGAFTNKPRKEPFKVARPASLRLDTSPDGVVGMSRRTYLQAIEVRHAINS